jgi:hypothetical protein
MLARGNQHECGVGRPPLLDGLESGSLKRSKPGHISSHKTADPRSHGDTNLPIGLILRGQTGLVRPPSPSRNLPPQEQRLGASGSTRGLEGVSPPIPHPGRPHSKYNPCRGPCRGGTSPTVVPRWQSDGNFQQLLHTSRCLEVAPVTVVKLHVGLRRARRSMQHSVELCRRI